MVAALFVAFTQDVPPGFVPADERAIFQRGPDARSSPDWMVTLRGDRLRVETRVAWYQRDRREAAASRASAGQVSFTDGMGRLTWRPGEGVRVSDGWLYGYDAGEFGGGLFWFSPDGKSHRKISGRNTQLVLRTSRGIFAVQGLTHLMFWYGRLVAVERKGDAWSERPITDLHASPAVVADGERFIVATHDYVSTLETDGTQREIYRGFGDYRVDSMVRRANGEVWIGSSDGLLRLRPKKGGDYAAQWFLPLK